MTGSVRFSVVIPTYQRPVWIRRAVLSLAAQSRPPDEVIAVARDDDWPTHEAIAALQREALPFQVRQALVTAPGFMPPVKTGIATATGDLIGVMDDDAEAADGWAERMLAHYADPTIGAVGGRCINSTEEGPVPVPRAERVGYMNRRGQFVGQMYYEPAFTDPIDVVFLMGGNMSFRAEVARQLEFDMSLNKSVASAYEVDLGLQVRRMGKRILFDPRIAIRHYSAPRAQVGLRAVDGEAVQWYAFNQFRVALRRLPALQALISTAYQLAVGERRAPGLLPLLSGPVGRKLGFDLPIAPAALRGRIRALRSVLPV